MKQLSDGRNFVVHPGLGRPLDRRIGGLKVREIGLRDLLREFANGSNKSPTPET